MTEELHTHLKLRDQGNLEPGSLTQEAYFGEVEEAAAHLFGRICPFFIGGNHTVTIPLLKATARMFQAPPLRVIYLDLHRGRSRRGGATFLALNTAGYPAKLTKYRQGYFLPALKTDCLI